MRGEEFAKEIEDRRMYQINNLGGFYKVFPVEDIDQSYSGGLFRNSIAKKAKSYYSKFERNGNMAYTQQGAQGILQSVIKQKKDILNEKQKKLESASINGQNASSGALQNIQMPPPQQQQNQQQLHPALQQAYRSANQSQTGQVLQNFSTQVQLVVSNSPSQKQIMVPQSSKMQIKNMQDPNTKLLQYNQPQTLKQTMFSIPSSGYVEGHQQQVNMIQLQDQAIFAGNQAVIANYQQTNLHQKDKRHQSVEPNSNNIKQDAALIPNGLNNGRMFRRQSSDTNPGVMQASIIDQSNGSIQNKNGNSNAWVRRMRFVMAQATQQNFLPNGQSIPNTSPNIMTGNTGQQNYNIAPNQIPNMIQPHTQSGLNPKTSSGVPTTQTMVQDGQGKNLISSYPTQRPILETQNQINIQQAHSVPQNININKSMLKSGAQNFQQSAEPVQQKTQTPINNFSAQQKPHTRSKQGSAISMQAVKQIKAEAFKCYISQATQLQQKILEQSFQSRLVGGRNEGSSSDLNQQRPVSQEALKKDALSPPKDGQKYAVKSHTTENLTENKRIRGENGHQNIDQGLGGTKTNKFNEGLLPDVNVHLSVHPMSLPNSSQATTNSTAHNTKQIPTTLSHAASKSVKFPSAVERQPMNLNQKSFQDNAQAKQHSQNIYRMVHQSQSGNPGHQLIDTDSSFKPPMIGPNSSKSVVVQMQHSKNQKSLNNAEYERYEHPINTAGSQIINNFTKSPIHSLAKQLNGELTTSINETPERGVSNPTKWQD